MWSSGKSSVVESLVGRSMLLRGTGIVRRTAEASIGHSYQILILVEIFARDGVGCIFSSFLRATSKRIHFTSKEAKEIFSTTLV